MTLRLVPLRIRRLVRAAALVVTSGVLMGGTCAPPKLVGIDYATWFPPYDFSRTWDQPAAGAYSLDSATITRHASQLSQAGVDFIWVDWSNDVACCSTPNCCVGQSPSCRVCSCGPPAPFRCDFFQLEQNTEAVFNTYVGLQTHPKVAIFIGSCADGDCQTAIVDGRLQAKADQVYSSFIANSSYNAIYQYVAGKPLLVVYVGTPSPFGGALPSWTDSRFTVRWLTGWVDSQPVDVSGRSNYWSFKDRLTSASPTYNWDSVNDIPEHMAVVSAFPGQHYWGELGGLTRNGLLDCGNVSEGSPGTVFDAQWLRVRDVDPEIVTVATWNEWITSGLDTSDEYTPACSSDIEPATTLGDLYLNLMKQNIAAFRHYRGDVILRDSNNGRFYFRNSPNFSFETQYQWPGNSGANYTPFACDMNGDGYGDIGLWDQNIGTFYWRLGPGFGTQQQYQWVGASGSGFQPFVGDFDGDNKCDLGVREKSSGTFYWRIYPQFTTQAQFQWASGANYQPFVGDFNGDGKLDIGLRDSNGGPNGAYFFWRLGSAFSVQNQYQWAPGTNYRALSGDFNGDGSWDIALRDSNNGVIYYKVAPDFGNNQFQVNWAPGTQYVAVSTDLR